MKKLMYIIPVLVLALILSFTAACDEVESTNETKQNDVTLEEEVGEKEAEESETDVQELMEACAQGNLEDVKRLLVQNTDVNAKDNNGFTALIHAAGSGHTEIAGVLIDNGADVNAKDNKGWMALMWASYLGYTEIAELLIDNGSDVNAKDNDGMTALMWAALDNHTEIVKLLIDNGADVNIKSNDGLTALMYAAEGKEGYTEIVNLLKGVEEEAVEESVE